MYHDKTHLHNYLSYSPCTQKEIKKSKKIMCVATK